MMYTGLQKKKKKKNQGARKKWTAMSGLQMCENGPPRGRFNK